MKKFKTKKDLENSKFLELELSHANHDAKYILWAKEGYKYDTDCEQYAESFYTVKDMLRWINLTGVIKC